MLVVTFSIISTGEIHSQMGSTIGLLSRESTVSDIYILVGGISGDEVYLINNCGRYIHSWQDLYSGGLSSYLTTDGSLYRSEIVSGSFSSGGSTGQISKYNWDGDLVWRGTIAEEDVLHHHHDITILPNGNILALVWEAIDKDVAISLGRAPSLISDSGIYAEVIYEIQPFGTQDYEIVWRWNVLDHLVQDFDPSLLNYGVISENPHCIDFNYSAQASGTNPDYFHFNAIDYHPQLDQILVSSRTLSEIFIIDHSTTIAEAASSTGGNSGRGGDLLFRYGNPAVYQIGDSNDQVFYGQHDARWVRQLDGSYNSTLSVYNNGSTREGNYSTIDEVNATWDPISKTYPYSDELGFAVSQHSEVIDGNAYLDFNSSRMSGATKLYNGNYSICHALEGRLHEIDTDGQILWEYRYPVNQSGSMTQGDFPTGNTVFKTAVYHPTYSAFVDRDLSSQGPIEIDPVDDNCTISNAEQIFDSAEPLMIPTMWNDQLELYKMHDTKSITILNLHGQIVKQLKNSTQSNQISINTSTLPSGMYLLMLDTQRYPCFKL